MRLPRRSLWFIPPILCVLGCSTLVAQSVSERSVTGAGCVQGAGGTMRLAGTLGQPIIGVAVTAGRQLGEGFWYAPSPKNAATAENPVAGDGVAALRCSPNPIEKSATVEVRVPHDGHVMLALHDLLGRPVRTLIDEQRQAGTFTIEMDINGIATGRYTLTMSTAHERSTLPVIVAR